MPPETPTTSMMSRFDRKAMSYAGIGILAGLVIGLIIGQNLSGGNSGVKPAANTVNNSLLNQSATAQGKLVAMAVDKLTLESVDGTRNEYPVSSNVNIFVYKDKTTPASASADLQVLELNREVLVSLGVVSGEYQVVTITVIPLDTVPTPSATPRRN